MKRRLGVLSFLVCGALLVASGPVGAGLSDKEDEFCNAFNDVDISSQPMPNDSGGFDDAEARAAAKEFKGLAKKAPTKSVKKAVKNMSKFFKKAAKIDSANDARKFVLSSDFTKYTMASFTLSSYLADACLSALIPDDLPPGE